MIGTCYTETLNKSINKYYDIIRRGTRGCSDSLVYDATESMIDENHTLSYEDPEYQQHLLAVLRIGFEKIFKSAKDEYINNIKQNIKRDLNSIDKSFNDEKSNPSNSSS